jgi:hypothetical protein
VISSTWGAGSLLETRPDILPQLAGLLPREEYCLAAIVHPNAWSWHGPLQIRAWSAEATRRGLILVDPEEGWRAVLTAADCLIGDHGSVTAYGAAIGVPVLFGALPAGHVVPGTPIARLGEIAPRLGPGPPASQVRHIMDTWPGEECAAVMRGAVTDAPGQSARIIRRVMYELIGLPEPHEAPRADPMPRPGLVGFHPGQADLRMVS